MIKNNSLSLHWELKFLFIQILEKKLYFIDCLVTWLKTKNFTSAVFPTPHFKFDSFLLCILGTAINTLILVLCVGFLGDEIHCNTLPAQSDQPTSNICAWWWFSYSPVGIATHPHVRWFGVEQGLVDKAISDLKAVSLLWPIHQLSLSKHGCIRYYFGH